MRAAARLSMAEVARLAGTTKSTVSRVLSNRQGVSHDLRQRVLEVVRQTRYVPHAAASALARRRSARKGFIHHTIVVAFCVEQRGFSAFWSPAYRGILEAAHEAKLSVITCLVRHDELDGHIRPEAFARAQFDGVLILPLNDADHSILRQFGPSVMFGSVAPEAADEPVVGVDNRAGVAALIAHLASLGHRRFEYVPQDLKRFPFQERRDAFLEALAKRQLAGTVAEPVGEDLRVYAEQFARRPTHERPTALVVSEDMTAIRLLWALQRVNVGVPEDVSVVGFDGIPGGRVSLPPLTTWHVRWEDLGRIAVRTLIDRIEGKPVAARTLVGGELVIRESTGASAPAPWTDADFVGCRKEACI